jgi:hypothetical protein
VSSTICDSSALRRGRDPVLAPRVCTSKSGGLTDESSHPELCSEVADSVTRNKSVSFSESWMREIRLSGPMSGNREQNQAKPD